MSNCHQDYLHHQRLCCVTWKELAVADQPCDDWHVHNSLHTIHHHSANNISNKVIATLWRQNPTMNKSVRLACKPQHTWKLQLANSNFVAKFYGSFNNILNVMGQSKSRNEMVAVHFIKTYCLPSMVYSCEAWAINRSDIRTLDIAWNNAFRKTFNGFWRERECQTTVILLLVSAYFCSVA